MPNGIARPMNPLRTLVALLTTLAFLATGCGKPNAVSPITPATPAVSVAHPIPQLIHEWDEFTGRLSSPETVEVRARVSGFIEKVHFKEGSDVQKGDLLFSIDPRPFQATVDRLRAELGATVSRSELARGEAKRAEALAATKAISTDTYENRLKTAEQFSQSVHAAEAALKSAELDLEFTHVRAPISGRISNARITAGNLVTGGSSANATLLTTVVSLDPLFCYFDADEASVLRYSQLQREGKRSNAMASHLAAEIALGNEQGFPHQGHIDFVDNQLNPATGTIRIRAIIPNPDRLMAPGFFARVRIPGNSDYNALLIRDNAISSDQGRLYVLVLDPQNKAAYRPIKTGPLIDGLRVVREGLAPSDSVIVSGLMAIRPGSTVQPQTVPMLTNAPAISSPAKP